METTNEALMTLAEVARRLRCSLANAHNLVATGRLKAYRIGAGGKGYRVTEAMLQDFLRRSVDDERPPSRHIR